MCSTILADQCKRTSNGERRLWQACLEVRRYFRSEQWPTYDRRAWENTYARFVYGARRSRGRHVSRRSMGSTGEYSGGSEIAKMRRSVEEVKLFSDRNRYLNRQRRETKLSIHDVVGEGSPYAKPSAESRAATFNDMHSFNEVRRRWVSHEGFEDSLFV